MRPDDRFERRSRAAADTTADVAPGDRTVAGRPVHRDERHTDGDGPYVSETGPEGGMHGRWAALQARRHRVREALRRRRTLNLVYRLAVALIGSVVAGIGIAMLALPGPGWAAIFVGLAILATEFHWARRLLHWAHDMYEVAKNRAMDPKVRRRNQIIGVVVLLAAVGGAVLYVVRFGVPLL